MKKRPTSVTVISWILIVMGGLSFITTTLALNNPTVRDLMSKSLIPIPLQFVITYIGLVVTLTSGVFMLRGKSWARLLYVVWSGFAFLVGILTSPMKVAMIPGLVVFVVFVFFLFRPKANEFFAHTSFPDDSESV